MLAARHRPAFIMFDGRRSVEEVLKVAANQIPNGGIKSATAALLFAFSQAVVAANQFFHHQDNMSGSSNKTALPPAKAKGLAQVRAGG